RVLATNDQRPIPSDHSHFGRQGSGMGIIERLAAMCQTPSSLISTLVNKPLRGGSGCPFGATAPTTREGPAANATAPVTNQTESTVSFSSVFLNATACSSV